MSYKNRYSNQFKKSTAKKRGVIVLLEDIPFAYRVAIWALRMSLQGNDGIKKMREQFQRALPPSAARIAIQSIENILDSVGNYGHRNLYLNCMQEKTISLDEKKILAIFSSVSKYELTSIQNSVETLVNVDGFNLLTGGIFGFLISMETRRNINKKTSSADEASNIHCGSNAIH